MSLPPVSFLTPIKYGNQPTTLKQKLTEFVDAYFHLAGRVAEVVPGKQQNGCEAVKLNESKAIWWQSTLKVMSYGAYFLNLAITAQFPSIRANRSFVQFQLIVSCFPVVMLLAKIVLRSTSHFYLLKKENSQEGKAAEEKFVGAVTKFEKATQEDLIPLKVRKTLDDLLGGEGSVDNLPVYKGNSYEVDSMTAPIMKGIAVNSQNKANPFIMIKMQCLNEIEEIKKKRPCFEFSQIKGVLVLRPRYLEDLLMWKEAEREDLSPFFFKGTFTYSSSNSSAGDLIDEQTKGFELLKRIIKEGEGEDITGLCWKLIK